jgi:hypothetical protein
MVWEEICQIQQKLSIEQLGLPDPQISNLRDTEQEIILLSKTYSTRDKLGQFIVKTKYIEKLFPIFEECELLYNDLESADALQELFVISNILKSISIRSLS